MHFIWWFVWLMLLFWIFVIPFDIPSQRRRRGSPLDILQRRFAAGEITKVDYEERKQILKNDRING